MMDLFGNFQSKQEQIKSDLESIVLEYHSSRNEVSLKMNGLKELKDISIHLEGLPEEKKEKLEDILIVSFNEILAQVIQKESELTQNSLKDMLPPGFENLMG